VRHPGSTEEARGPRGDLLYRWGNPSAYGQGDAGGKRFFYQHDVRWIPDGWEGAGNLTVFNSGEGRAEVSYSSIDQHPYAVYRATRILADHPGLANRKFSALDPQPAWFEFATRNATRKTPTLSSTAGRR
jgi:hypothetical protein